MSYWIATGDVRGPCGHHHKTEGAALRCADSDQRAVRRAYPSTFPATAYSDRRPKEVVDAAEAEAVPAPPWSEADEAAEAALEERPENARQAWTW